MEEIDIRYDTKKIKKFIKKYYIVLLLIIPIFFAIFFRAYTYDLPMTDKLAEESMERNIKNQIQSEIMSQTRDIDQNTLDILTSQRYQAFISSNQQAITDQTEQVSQQLKNYYKDDSGQTYLLAIDPYYYYRQTKNVLENGHVGDEIRDGQPFNNHMYAPNGKPVSNSFHPFAGAILHKISSIFGNDSLMKTMFILPLLFATLSVIPIFFIARKVSGNLGGVVAAFVLAIHPAFLGRTPAGFADTDAYGIFFSSILIWLFMETFTAKTNKSRYILGVSTGLLTGIFSFAWSGWWYMFDIILAGMGVYFIYLLIKYHKNIFKKLKTKNLIKTGAIYLLSSALFVSIFMGRFRAFFKFLEAPASIIFIKEAAKKTLWPNVYTTVAELNKISMSSVVSQLGGKILVAIAVIGILFVFLKKKKVQLDIKYGILLILWAIVTLYTTTKGVRFVMFMVPVFAIGLGIFFGKAYTLIIEWASKELDLSKKLLSICLILLTVVSFVPLTKSANETAIREAPSMNDAWYDSLTKIERETPEDAIVNSWWDFGHWFKAIADRKVTFDGASQNNPQAHWMGKILLTDNEEEAIAILRMLDCGANDAYDFLLEETQDPLLTKEIIDRIILEDENTARNTLSEYVENPNRILEKTHCNPPENYFITSQDMVSKSAVWAHFGSWDFKRAFAYTTIKSNPKEEALEILMDRLEYSQEEAERTYRQLKGISEEDANQWIAPYPGYSGIGSCQNQNNTFYCSNGIIIDQNKRIAKAQTTEGEEIFLDYRDDENIYLSENPVADTAAAYFPHNSQIMMMNPELLGSMFTELYFYEGKNLNRFELFHHETGMDGFNIYIWKVKW
ncbi:hypothetical protein HOC06_00535 [Candidatus Woesearchaeota archaeon]|jgi:dolichyl-phosphooligosaccharide-protein glycotransferase|nr:hypothetical protein [Candidatus Woesearchaeota archaeon]MBT4630698.1 hypothetical protein [Candidatus Woesearchaeota archaeon]